jgi:hypothetical protein
MNYHMLKKPQVIDIQEKKKALIKAVSAYPSI